MSLPPLEGKFSGAELSRFDAPALFASRARDVLPAFQLDDSNAIVISAICRRLDGLPLALELAAARLKLFSLENLLSRLDNALDTLGVATRDRPDRQQTIRAAIAWSYDLLAPAEQSFLEQMSIFSGGFALDSAEAVGVVPDARPIDLLGSLLDNSLVRRIETAGDEPRFGMLELVRQFANSKLQRRADLRAVQNRLAEHFLEVAATAAPELASAHREQALRRLSQDNDNLEQALTHLLALGDADAALRLAADLSWYWYHVGRFTGGRAWLSRCLALRPASSSPAVRAAALTGSARLARYQLDMEPARDLARKAMEQANLSSDDRTLGYALYVLGLVEQVDADPRAVGHAQLAAETLRRAGDAWGEALALFYTGAFAIFLGPREVVRPALDESGRIFREMGDVWGLAGALFYLGMLDRQEGETIAARRLIEESVELFRKSGDRWRLQTALDFHARLVGDAGEDASGIRAEVAAIRRDLGIKQS
jgi:tetratricopeptide (TPR) repeat protein